MLFGQFPFESEALVGSIQSLIIGAKWSSDLGPTNVFGGELRKTKSLGSPFPLLCFVSLIVVSTDQLTASDLSLVPPHVTLNAFISPAGLAWMDLAVSKCGRVSVCERQPQLSNRLR